MGEGRKSWRLTNGKKTFTVHQGTGDTGRVVHRDGTSSEISGRYVPEDGDRVTLPKHGATARQGLFGRRYKIEEID